MGTNLGGAFSKPALGGAVTTDRLGLAISSPVKENDQFSLKSVDDSYAGC